MHRRRGCKAQSLPAPHHVQCLFVNYSGLDSGGLMQPVNYFWLCACCTNILIYPFVYASGPDDQDMIRAMAAICDISAIEADG